MLGPIFVNLLANRRKPPLAKLKEIKDPEQFFWHILPHAARTFSLVIVFLPPRMRRALALAYLYCRMLDTYEDLLPTVHEKEETTVHEKNYYKFREEMCTSSNYCLFGPKSNSFLY